MRLRALRVLRARKYESGTTWCLWRWTDVEDNILRLHLFKTPWNAVCVHWLRAPDPEVWMHDHPVSFISLVLRGQYCEIRTLNGGRLSVWRVVKWINFMRASSLDRHRIVEVAPRTITLCLMGPKRREWGFHTKWGFIPWRNYYKRKREGMLGS